MSAEFKIICRFMKEMRLWKDFHEYQNMTRLVLNGGGAHITNRVFNETCDNAVSEFQRSYFLTFLTMRYGSIKYGSLYKLFVYWYIKRYPNRMHIHYVHFNRFDVLRSAGISDYTNSVTFKIGDMKFSMKKCETINVEKCKQK